MTRKWFWRSAAAVMATLSVPAFAAPVMVTTAPYYTEGVVFDADGTLYFSQTATGVISRLAPGSAAATEWALVPGANGHKILPDGTHIVAGAHAMFAVTPDGKPRRLFSSVDGTALTYPNDIAVEPRGGFYFTDSGSTDGNEQQTRGSVYYVDAAMVPRRIATGLGYANGLALSPDGKRLYVDAGLPNQIMVYDLAGAGQVSGRGRLLAQLPGKRAKDSFAKPDGMIVDMATGNIIVAHYGTRQILVLSPDGALLRRLPAGNKAVSNLALHQGTRHLYVSGAPESEDAGGAIFRVELPR